jgi:arylsulfatase A-like enzyme
MPFEEFYQIKVGDVIKRLEDEGVLEQTFVIFTTDHGISHARGKQFLYDEGIHVPLIIRGPGIAQGIVREDLIEQIDLAPTSLALAHIDIPQRIQGHHLFAANKITRDAVFSARDRCDETVEQLRSVRTESFKYIRNGYPNRPHLQPNAYKDGKPIVKRIRELHEQHQLNELQERLLFSKIRPREELYDLKADPYEVRNLADDPAYSSQLLDLRNRLDQWMIDSNDLGREPESAAMYDSDMKVYLEGKNSTANAILEKNIAQMKKWSSEGH